MSALGQKQTLTFRSDDVRFTSKADKKAMQTDACFVPIADIPASQRNVRSYPKSGHGVAPSEQMSFAIAAMASGRGPGEDRLRPRCVPQPKFCSLGVRMILFDLGETQSRRSTPGSLPTLAVCAVLGLFAACVQRL